MVRNIRPSQTKVKTKAFMLLAATLLMIAGAGFSPSNSVRAQGPDLSGTIAYVHNGDEIRLIEPDGSNDRLLWALPQPDVHQINGVDWSPDGGTLAFTSDHERTCSIYDSDVFTIGADGADLRRLTNSPACSELGDYPTGTVVLEIENQVSDQNLFVVYVEGSLTAQTVTLAPGEVKQLVFPNVADFGNGVLQKTSASVGFSRWVDPSVVVDVVAGGTANAVTRLVLGPLNHFKWNSSHPSWRHDGATIGFVLSDGVLNEITRNPAVGSASNLLVLGEGGSLGSQLSRSPVANEILFSHNTNFDIYHANLDVGTPSELLVEIPDNHLVYGIDWLPDGSGFVFAVAEGEFFDETVNLYEYTFATDGLSKLTNFTTEVAAHPSVSPDGQYIAFAYQTSLEAETAELRVMTRNGSEIWSLNVPGILPDWSTEVGSTPTPQPTGTETSTPEATPTATETPVSTPTDPVPTPTPSSSPDGNLVLNGSFESGDLSSWIVPEDSTATTTEGAAHEGNHAAFFGGINDAAELFYQQLELPNSGGEATLSFWVNQFGEEVADGADLFCAALYAAGTEELIFDLGCLDGVEALDVDYNPDAWWRAVYLFSGADWEALRGESVLLTFEMFTDDSLLSTVYIDDVLFQVGDANATPVPTSTPTAGPTPEPNAGRDWTAILYIDGDNNLCDSYPRLIERMENELGPKIGPDGFLNVAVLIDHHPEFCAGQSNAIRYVVQPNGDYTDGVNRWDMGEINMGDPQTLVDFATWAMQAYPADHYYLAIDDHGGGITGIAWDDSNNHDQLTTADLHAALEAITANGQRKIDVFAYEACLMGMVENAYDVRNFTDYIFFFPTISWTNNASYPSYFGDPRFTASTDGAALGDILFDVYYEAVTRPYVVSLVESRQLEDVQNALNAWSTALQAQLGSSTAAIDSARAAAQKVDANNDDFANDDDAYVDLWDAADKMAAQGVAVAESNALKAAIEAAVRRVNYRPGDAGLNIDYSNAHGLTIFWPQSTRGPYPYSDYISGELYAATNASSWDDFLKSYLGNDGRRGMSATIGPVDRRVAPDIEVPSSSSNQMLYLPLVQQ